MPPVICTGKEAAVFYQVVDYIFLEQSFRFILYSKFIIVYVDLLKSALV